MKKVLTRLFLIPICLGFLGCYQTVRTDLETLNDNPEAYKDKLVIVMADLKNVAQNEEGYLGKRVEIAGYIEKDGFGGLSGWNFVLKDKTGNFLTCYEEEYRVDAWKTLELVLRNAKKNGDQITVLGRFRRGMRIELDHIEYKGCHFNTDFKPPMFIF